LHSQIEQFIKNGTPFVSEQVQADFKKFISDKQITGLAALFTDKDFSAAWDDKTPVELTDTEL